ncbi:MAG TPA: fibronectin type III domain-containing protein [Phycisphaerales bacterium]|nr:fibronectin type III domain-containing protein [Phycisphaerales bacterium]
MPKFPTRQADIIALANQMLAGYAAHIADFPNANLGMLRGRHHRYWIAKRDRVNARAAAHLATEAKRSKLAELKEVMKNCLRKSEVDVAGNPEKLAQIGWGPKAPPQPTDIPGQPTNLRAIAQGQGELSLKWDRPAGDSGDPVRNYIIERHQQSQNDGQFSQWTLTGTVYQTQINLSNQLQGIQLEYRVKAVNTAGESSPSNTAMVVL